MVKKSGQKKSKSGPKPGPKPESSEALPTAGDIQSKTLKEDTLKKALGGTKNRIRTQKAQDRVVDGIVDNAMKFGTVHVARVLTMALYNDKKPKVQMEFGPKLIKQFIEACVRVTPRIVNDPDDPSSQAIPLQLENSQLENSGENSPDRDKVDEQPNDEDAAENAHANDGVPEGGADDQAGQDKTKSLPRRRGENRKRDARGTMAKIKEQNEMRKAYKKLSVNDRADIGKELQQNKIDKSGSMNLAMDSESEESMLGRMGEEIMDTFKALGYGHTDRPQRHVVGDRLDAIAQEFLERITTYAHKAYVEELKRALYKRLRSTLSVTRKLLDEGETEFLVATLSAHWRKRAHKYFDWDTHEQPEKDGVTWAQVRTEVEAYAMQLRLPFSVDDVIDRDFVARNLDRIVPWWYYMHMNNRDVNVLDNPEYDIWKSMFGFQLAPNLQ